MEGGASKRDVVASTQGQVLRSKEEDRKSKGRARLGWGQAKASCYDGINIEGWQTWGRMGFK